MIVPRREVTGQVIAFLVRRNSEQGKTMTNQMDAATAAECHGECREEEIECSVGNTTSDRLDAMAAELPPEYAFTYAS